MRLFLNANSRTYLRELVREFDASPGHVRSELTQLRAAGLLASEKRGRQVQYRADTTHPLYAELHSMVRKALGMDRILDSIIQRLGDLESAYLTGDYAQGRDTGIIDLVLVGGIQRRNLDDLVAKTERYIQRRIRVLILSAQELQDIQQDGRLQPLLMLWQGGDQA
jgi:DNA-binding transcriptional ArsR family regulator